MRRIISDIISRGSHLMTRPTGDQRRLRTPEPAEGNVGPTLFQGVGEWPRKDHELLIGVQKSGNYTSAVLGKGSTFKVKPDILKDASGNEVLDAYNWMGAGAPFSSGFRATLVSPTSTQVLGQPKMIELKHWGAYSSSQGRVGLAVVGRTDGASSATILAWTLSCHEDQAGAMSWNTVATGIVSAIGDRGGNVPPAIDLVELDDGTILCLLVESSALYVYKSFDGGDEWEEIYSDTSIATRSNWRCGVEVLDNGRVVMVFGAVDAGTVRIYSRYSDDGGFSWTSGSDVVNHAPVPAPTNFSLELVRSQSGELGCAWPDDSDNIQIATSGDGKTWSTGLYGLAGDNFLQGLYCASLVQERAGRWLCYGSVITDEGLPKLFPQNDPDPMSLTNQVWIPSGANAGEVLPDCHDADHHSYYACARPFMDGAFVDLFVVWLDDASTDYWCMTMHRCSMWGSPDLQTYGWTASYDAHVYPSAADPDPALGYWSKGAGGGSATLTIYGLHLVASSVQNINYYVFPGSAQYYADGILLKAIVSEGTGDGFRFRITASDAGVGQVQFSVYLKFDSDVLTLYDETAGAQVDSYAPTNWSTTEMQFGILIVYQGRKVQVYRFPVQQYNQIEHCELVLSYDLLTIGGYVGANDEVRWGVISAGSATDVVVESVQFKDFAIAGDEPPISFDFDVDVVGRKCVVTPQGILDGFSAQFGGAYAVAGDQWELDAGAVYEADNIFEHSPSRCWREPAVAAGVASAAQTFEWRRKQDSSDEDLHYTFDTVAIFGRNWLDFTMTIKSWDGVSSKNLFNTAVGFGRAYLVEWAVKAGGIDDNVVTVWPTAGAPSLFEPMIRDQFASDGARNWYIRVSSGTAGGKTYRISGNTETTLFLSENAQADGVVAGDTFKVFSSSLVLFWPDFLTDYARVQFVISSQTRAADEQSLKLGTIVIGRGYDLPDDEWGARFGWEANNSLVVAKSGIQRVARVGPMVRTIDLRYTGLTDKGMAVTKPAALFRSLGGGQYPLVWVDDDSMLDNSQNNGAHDAILGRLSDKLSSGIRAYTYADEGQDVGFNIGNVIRGVHDVDGFTIREVL
jgi:hypothetical protein